MFLPCRPCCEGGSCPADGKPAVDPTTVPDVAFFGSWYSSTSYPTPYSTGTTSDKVYYFYGSASTSDASGSASVTQQQDWDNICNWYTEYTTNPASYPFTFSTSRLSKRAPTLPPSDAIVWFFTTPRLNTARTVLAAYFMGSSVLQGGDDLTCTGSAHDSPGGAVFSGSAHCDGTLNSGATFAGFSRLTGTVNGSVSFRYGSGMTGSPTVNGNAIVPSGTHSVEWSCYSGGANGTITGSVSAVGRLYRCHGLQVGGTFETYDKYSDVMYCEIAGLTTAYKGRYSFCTFAGGLTMYCPAQFDTWAVDTVDASVAVTCYGYSQFSGTSSAAITLWDTSEVNPSTYGPPTSVTTITLNDTSRIDGSGTVAASGAVTLYDSSQTLADEVTASSFEFNNSSQNTSSMLYGDCVFNDSSKNFYLIYGSATFNGTSEMHNSVSATATFNDTAVWYDGGCTDAVLNHNTVASFTPSVYGRALSSATFNDSACTTGVQTDQCPSGVFVSRFWIVPIFAGATQTCNGVVSPDPCVTPPPYPTCGCHDYP